MYVHTGTWPYKCDICTRGFGKLTNLKNHMHQHEAGGRLDVEDESSEDIQDTLDTQDTQDTLDTQDTSPIKDFLLNMVKSQAEQPRMEDSKTMGFPTLFRPINM